MLRLTKAFAVMVAVLLFTWLAPPAVRAYDLTDLKTDLNFLVTQTPVESALLFDVFGTNPDPNFQKHQLTEFQINELCGGDCGAAGIGVNFATYYKGGDYAKARNAKMQWSLEIASSSTPPERVADIINNEQVDNIIVRIGTAQGSEGFDNPSDYGNFLRAIAGLTNKPFYAIAGPNEPDIEHWAAASCGGVNGSDPDATRATFYDCVGPALATYMNAIISQGLPSNVRLLSPAFNLTSFTFDDDTGRPDGIPRAMLRAGANFGALYGVAGNIYPNGDTMQNIWTGHVATVIGELGRPVVITETGPWSSISEAFAGYENSIYDAYNAEQDQFYIHPIRGLNRSIPPGGPPWDQNLKNIRDDLINQGYEARCATPAFKIELTQAGKDWMADYVEQSPGGYGAVFGGAENYYIRNRQSGPPGIGNYVRSWLAVDYREVQVPVFRDVSDKRFLMTSLEEYFGFKDTVIQENTKAELNSAAINSLLTNQQRCQASVRILLKQEEMCNKLANPDVCALYSRPVPETGYTIKTLLDTYKGLAAAPHPDIQPVPLPGYTDPVTIQQVCNTVVQTDWNEDARKGFLYTPLTIDRAYRLAFLVTSIELKHPTYDSMFNFYVHPNEGPVGGPSKPDDAILINAFKVPDILTTTQDKEGSLTVTGNTPWVDSSKLTRNSLITRATQTVYTDAASERKNELQRAAGWYDYHSQTSSDEIFCLYGASNHGIGAPECIDELGKAVIDIVNAQSQPNASDLIKIEPDCPDLNKESAESVLDFGSFGSADSVRHPDPQLFYTQDFGAELLHNIFEVPEKGQDPTEDLDATHQIEPKGESHPSFAETWKPGDPDDGTNPLGSPRDWGLKSLFHVTDQTYPNFPYNGCCDERVVHHFLVYPVGYDMETVQTVLAGSFFTTSQLESLTAEAEAFDRIQVSGDTSSFTGGTRDETFADTSIQPPNWNGQPGMIPVGQQGGVDISTCVEITERTCNRSDPVTNECFAWRERLIGWELPCQRTFGWEIEQKGHDLPAGILGARLGFWLRSIQKALNSGVGTARDYLDSCATTEQFLTGHCGEEVTPVVPANPVDPNCTALSCTPPTPLPTAPVTPPLTPYPTGGGCTDPNSDAIVFETYINENREWKVKLTCPSCQGTWGDIRTEITLPTGESWGWGPNSLPLGGYLEYPCGGAEPCAGYGSQVPAGYSGPWCVAATITSNNVGNQCGGTLSYYACTTVQ
ncbi:hypothetical protein KC921_00665 [Candidatus Woesebacteria bacterium]|nr:hypothetical protein [Candidatus Woesebacteria bacterium]